jgi:hypothetical protein
MRLKIVLFILLALVINGLYSQQSEEFMGVLKVGDDVITYKINFSVTDKGVLTGESVTDFYGNDRTVSIISGTFNSKTNKISFKEIKNTMTKSKAEEAYFCYVQVDNAQIKEVRKNRVIEGTFKGVYPDGKECSKGEVKLISTKVLDVLKEQGINVDSLKNVESLDIKNIKPISETNQTILKGGDDFEINWISDSIIIEVWDNYLEDGDVIDIVINDVLVSSDLEIKNQKHKSKTSINNEKTVVKIIAKNEGSAPMTTVSIRLIDGKNATPMVAKLKKGESVLISFIK